jgi:hypothetical protein
MLMKYGIDLATLDVEEQKNVAAYIEKKAAKDVANRPKVEISGGLYPGAPVNAYGISYGADSKPVVTRLNIAGGSDAGGTSGGAGAAGGTSGAGGAGGAGAAGGAPPVSTSVDLKRYALQVLPGNKVPGGDPKRSYFIGGNGEPTLIPKTEPPKPTVINAPGGRGLLLQNPETNELSVPKATPEAQAMLDAAKPLPEPTQRREDALLSSIQLVSAQSADLQGLRERINNGSLNMSLVGNVFATGKGLVGLSDEQYENLIELKTTLERLRNDSLMLAKGVQTEGDAKRAWNALFGSLSNEKSMLRQLEIIDQKNQRNAAMAGQRINNARANNKVPALDLTPFMTYGAVTKAFAPAPRDPAQRKVGETYLSPNNVAAKWTGKGWEPVR